jgi:hypothetical protein
MAISFIAESTAHDTANDDITVPGISSIQNGDFILGWYHGYGDTTISALPITLSGFTKLTERYETNSTDVSMGIFYKIANNEGESYSFVGSHTATPETGAHIAVFRGVNPNDPFDVTFVEATHYVRNTDVGITDTTQPKNITTNTNNAWCVILTSVTFGSVTNISPPSGFTERSQIIADNRNGHICTKLQATAGAVNPGTLGTTSAADSTDASHYTLALKPAANKVVTFSLLSKVGNPQASLSAVSWAWFDEDVGALNAPTDKGSIEVSDSSGEMILDLVNTTLTTGQTGTLALYDPTGGKIGAYRLEID